MIRTVTVIFFFILSNLAFAQSNADLPKENIVPVYAISLDSIKFYVFREGDTRYNFRKQLDSVILEHPILAKIQLYFEQNPPQNIYNNDYLVLDSLSIKSTTSLPCLQYIISIERSKFFIARLLVKRGKNTFAKAYIFDKNGNVQAPNTSNLVHLATHLNPVGFNSLRRKSTNKNLKKIQPACLTNSSFGLINFNCLAEHISTLSRSEQLDLFSLLNQY